MSNAYSLRSLCCTGCTLYIIFGSYAYAVNERPLPAACLSTVCLSVCPSAQNSSKMASGMSTAEKLLKNYPYFTDGRLPLFLGCPREHTEDEVKLAFQRICYKDVMISKVELLRSLSKPRCIYRIYYQLKNGVVNYDDSGNNSINSSQIFPPELPEDTPSLRKLYQDITGKCHHLEMQVVRKCMSGDRRIAIVEYTPLGCECDEIQRLNRATEAPQMEPVIAAVESNLDNMKIH